MNAIKWLFRLVVLTTVVVLAFANQHTVSVFGFTQTMQWQAPMAWVIALAWSVGLIVGCLFMLPYWWRARRLQSKLNSTTQHSAQDAAFSHPATSGSGVTSGQSAASIHPRSADWRAPGDDLGI